MGFWHCFNCEREDNLSWHPECEMCGHHRGHDIIVFENGDMYVGRTKDGKPDGFGILISAKTLAKHNKGNKKYYTEGFYTYRGGFKAGKYHGEGWLIPENGDYYRGGFANGKFHGKGELEFCDPAKWGCEMMGCSYEGEFFEGELHGKGIYDDGVNKAPCEFRNGERIK